MNVSQHVCQICGIAGDAGFFDEANIRDAPNEGQEIVLASYKLHRNYCGVLMSFAQFTDKYTPNNPNVLTTGYRWVIRCNGQPRDPYLDFEHILNPWGYAGMPVQLRLEEGCLVELAIRNVNVPAGDPRELKQVGGRITGRYWYNTEYGGAPNPL